MLESQMASAENAARKRHGGGKGNAEKFVNSERLRVLGIFLREDIKRFKEPVNVKAPNRVNLDEKENVEQELGSGFFKLKTK